MAKQLSMGQVHSILTLHQSGHSNRKIAKLLGVHRETVAKYLTEGEAEPAKPDHLVRPGRTGGLRSKITGSDTSWPRPPRHPPCT